MKALAKDVACPACGHAFGGQVTCMIGEVRGGTPAVCNGCAAVLVFTEAGDELGVALAGAEVAAAVERSPVGAALLLALRSLIAIRKATGPCPRCRRVVRPAVAVRSGDWGLCSGCGEVLAVAEDGAMRSASAEDIARFEEDPHFVAAIQWLHQRTGGALA